MAINSYPTGGNQYVWDYSEVFTKKAFLASVDIDDTQEELTAAIASILWDLVSTKIVNIATVGVGVIMTTATLMQIFTSANRKAMMQKIYDQFTAEGNTYTKCKVRVKFKSWQQGSQGWFWIPTTTYTLHYS